MPCKTAYQLVGIQTCGRRFPIAVFCYGNGQTALRLYFSISVKRKSCGARGVKGSAYLAPYSRAKFIESHCNGGAEMAGREFDEFVSEIPQLVANYESWTATQHIQGIQRYPILRTRSHRSF
jgi:hypothetical protein